MSAFPLQPAPAGYYTSTKALLDEIASLEEDVTGWETTVRQNRKAIPELERESLVCERDIAVARLKIMELQHEVEERTGGAQ